MRKPRCVQTTAITKLLQVTHNHLLNKNQSWIFNPPMQTWLDGFNFMFNHSDAFLYLEAGSASDLLLVLESWMEKP